MKAARINTATPLSQGSELWTSGLDRIPNNRKLTDAKLERRPQNKKVLKVLRLFSNTMTNRPMHMVPITKGDIK